MPTPPNFALYLIYISFPAIHKLEILYWDSPYRDSHSVVQEHNDGIQTHGAQGAASNHEIFLFTTSMPFTPCHQYCFVGQEHPERNFWMTVAFHIVCFIYICYRCVCIHCTCVPSAHINGTVEQNCVLSMVLVWGARHINELL